jgi:hypothetical protein
MADTPTALADVIVPEVFNPYFREASTRANAFFQSGVIAPVADLDLGSKGGALVQMPFWQALGERAQLLDDTDDLEIRKVETAQDTAVLNARALVYGGTDLAAALAGDDPMTAIADGIGENWSMEFNYQLIATLKGAFGALAAESPAGNNVVNISALSGAAAYIDGESFIDATQTLGDMKNRLVAVAMHSAVNAWLAKQGLIETVRDADGVVQYETFMGKRVIQDDAIAPTNGVYDTYLFGPGAIGYGEGNPKVPSATGREELLGGGQDYLVTRRHYVLHPRGVAWTPGNGIPAKPTPSDAELATAGNWTRKYQPKNIRMALLRHKIG